MVIGLHTTGSPVSRAERKNINENWERIIDGLTRLQTQINVLAGGKEVDDLLKSIQDAIDNAYSSVNKAIDENNAATQEAINNFNTSLELALSSISNALQVTETAITNANQATVDAKNVTSDANTAVKTINEKFVEATQVIDSLNALKIQLEQMEQQLETAQSDVEIATANANNATQSAVDATNTMVAKMDEADTAIANANNAANTANQATEEIKGWGTATVWNSTTTYEKNNVVTDNGSTWQALRQNTNTKPVEGLDWTCLARKGVDGTGSVGSVNGQYPDETGNVTLDLGQGTVKKVNGKDPDGTGEVVLTASDLGAFSGSLLENGSVIMKKLSQEVQDAIANASGGGNSYFRPYTLATTEEDQKTWGLPANSYDAATDSLLVFYNASLLDSALWNVTGDAGTGYKVNIPDAPIARILDNNVTVVVLKNGINGSPEEISGTLLTNASVGLQKLGQDVLDVIGNTGRSLKFSALSYDLPTTEENQKSWSLPIKFYDKNNDFVIVFHNGSHLSPASWEITEDAFNDYYLNISDNPITNIADNNVRIIIFKNVPTDGTERFSGILLEDGTVTIEKLDREVQDAISNADGKVEIVNNLTDGGIDKVLSSEMGKELKKQVDENSKTVTTLQQEVTDKKKEVTEHLADNAKHVTPTDRTKWNDVSTKAVRKALGYHPQNDANLIIDTSIYALNASGVNTPPVAGDGWTTMFTASPMETQSRSFQIGQKWNDNLGLLWYRRYNSAWENWKQIFLHHNTRLFKINLNDIQYAGTYAIGDEIVNSPNGDTSWGALFVTRSADYTHQTYHGLGGTYQRQFVSNAWKPWRKVLTQDDFTLPAPVTAVLGAGWSVRPGNSLTYYKDAFGVVHIRGRIDKSGGTPLITTLPVGYRPLTNFESAAQAGASQITYLDVLTDGQLRGNYVSDGNNILVDCTFRTT